MYSRLVISTLVILRLLVERCRLGRSGAIIGLALLAEQLTILILKIIKILAALRRR